LYGGFSMMWPEARVSDHARAHRSLFK
jgi:hypothetical protein